MTAKKYVKLFFISSLCLLILSSYGFDGNYVSKVGSALIHVNTTTSDTVVYGRNGGMLCWMICFGLYTLSALVVMIDLLFPFRLWGRRAGVGQS